MTDTAVVSADDEAVAALVNLVVVLADNKWFLGLHLSEWAVGAPVLESSVACAAIAQSHMGQARILYPLLEELPSPVAAGPPGKAADRGRRYNVSSLDDPFPTWPHVVAALCVVDTALNVLLGALAGCRYEALARRVGRMLEEERFQREFALGRVRELRAFPGGLEHLQPRIDAALPEMLCWFGPPGERGVARLGEQGFLTAGGEQMRQEYLDRILPVLEQADVRVPVRSGAAGWEYDALPWERWNRLQRRLTR